MRQQFRAAWSHAHRRIAQLFRPPRTAPARAWFARLSGAEELEPRCVLSGVWGPLGPSPQTDDTLSETIGRGPYSGRISSLAFGQHGPSSALFLGSASGGVWRSMNYASASPQWANLTDDIGLSDTGTGLGAGAITTGSIATAGSIVLSGTGEANNTSDSRYGTGILRSSDGGDTWSLTTGTGGASTTFFSYSISKVLYEPNQSKFYAAVVMPYSWSPAAGWTGLGLYQSADNGATWTKINGTIAGATLPTTSRITDIESTFKDGQLRLFAAVGVVDGSAANGVYIGTPAAGGGFTWQYLDAHAPLPKGSGIGRIALASDHTSTVYAAVTTSASKLEGVYKSVDNGATWTRVYDNSATPAPFPDGQMHYNLAFGLSPASGRLYLGGVSTVLEFTPGATSSRSIRAVTPGVRPHVDFHAFAFGPDNAVYAGTDGGLWRWHPDPFDLSKSYVTATNPVGLVSGLFNGDNKPDLAVVSRNATPAPSSRMEIFLNTGDGTFPVAPGGYLLPLVNGEDPEPVDLLSADFKQDGSPDLLVVNSLDQIGNVADVYVNNQDGTFAIPPGTVLSRRKTAAMAADDFNNDGAKDLVAVDRAGFGSFVRRFGNKDAAGRGDGTFGAAALFGANLWPSAVTTGKFNNDQFPDIAVLNSDTNDLAIYLNDGAGNFPGVAGNSYQADSWKAVATNPVALAAGQLNTGDTALDLVVVSNSGSVNVLLGNGDGTFANAETYIGGSSPSALALADLNNDGNLDIVITNKVADGRITILFGNGQGGFPDYLEISSRGSMPSDLAVDDYNKDGLLDIAVLNTGSDRLAVLLRNAGVPLNKDAVKWVNLNTLGPNTIQASTTAIHPSDPQQMLVGSQDNGVAQTSDAGNVEAWPTWSAAGTGGDGTTVRYGKATATPGVYSAYHSLQHGRFYRSDNNGLPGTWAEKVQGLTGAGDTASFPFDTKFAVNPTNPDTVLLGGMTKVWETTNAGQGWTEKGAPAGGTQGITALAYAPSNPQVVYAGFGDGKIFRSTNGGAAWTDISGNRAWTQAVRAIAVHPGDSDWVYVASGWLGQPGVHLNTSTTIANNWTMFNNQLPNVPAWALVIAEGRVYVGTDVGVYSSPIATSDWARHGTGLPYVQVKDLQQGIGEMSHLIAAATYGRGVWMTGLEAIDTGLSFVGEGELPGPGKGAVLGQLRSTSAGAGSKWPTNDWARAMAPAPLSYEAPRPFGGTTPSPTPILVGSWGFAGDAEATLAASLSSPEDAASGCDDVFASGWEAADFEAFRG